MKILLFALLSGLLLAFRPAATSYQVDPAASRLTWTGHAETGAWAPTGSLPLRRGQFAAEGTRLVRGRFEFELSGLTHTDARLQEHLRGEDFFDVVRFPTAVFVLEEARNGEARGQLTLKGITRPVRFPVTVERQPAGGLRVRGTASLDRTQFGVNYNSSSYFQNLGSYAIRNDFQLAFDLLAGPGK